MSSRRPAAAPVEGELSNNVPAPVNSRPGALCSRRRFDWPLVTIRDDPCYFCRQSVRWPGDLLPLNAGSPWIRSPARMPFSRTIPAPSRAHRRYSRRRWEQVFRRGAEDRESQRSAGRIDVGDRERQGRILHPKRGAFGLRHDKEHPASGARRSRNIKPVLRSCALIGDFRRHRLPAHAQA